MEVSRKISQRQKKFQSFKHVSASLKASVYRPSVLNELNNLIRFIFSDFQMLYNHIGN